MKKKTVLLLGVLSVLVGINPAWGQVPQVGRGLVRAGEVLPEVGSQSSRPGLGRALLNKVNPAGISRVPPSFPLQISSGMIPPNSRVIVKDPMWTNLDFPSGIPLTARVDSASEALGKQLLINKLSLGVREQTPSIGMLPIINNWFDVSETAFSTVWQSFAKSVLRQNQYLWALTQVRHGIIRQTPVSTLRSLTESAGELTQEIQLPSGIEPESLDTKLYVFRDSVFPRETVIFGAPAYSAADAATKQALLLQERNRCMSASQLVKRYQQTLEYLQQKQAPAEQINQYQTALNDAFVYYAETVARWLAVREAIVGVWPAEGIKTHLKEALSLTDLSFPSLRPMDVLSYEDSIFRFSSQDGLLTGDYPVASMEEGIRKQKLYEQVVSFERTQRQVLEDKINKLKTLESRAQDPMYRSQLFSLSSLTEIEENIPDGWMALADIQNEIDRLTQDIQVISQDLKNTPGALLYIREEIKKGTPLAEIEETVRGKYQLNY